jgi:hypothetical protein
MPQFVSSVGSAAEFEAVEAERVEIERLLRENTVALSKCDEPTAMAVSGAGSLRIQRGRPSTERAVLLREQRTLMQTRAAIYEQWSSLKVREETR